MALQLRNKVSKDKDEKTTTKTGKYKRKRNVFGKRLFRFGLVGTIVALVICFAVVKVIFTLQQNNRQKKIDKELALVKEQIQTYKRQINRKADTYENVGELIATLPVSFDRQATSLDLDRIVILSGLTESTLNTRKITEGETVPFECSVSTVKAVKIEMTLNGTLTDEEKPILKFIDYLTDYTHENFYYIENIDFKVDRTIQKRTETKITLYTFYNDIALNPTTQTNTTTTTK